MTAWPNDIVTTATTDLRRTQCAQAATARLKHPQVNLLGLGESGEATRRAKCLEAAMMRFVLGNEPSQPQSRGRGTKRKAHTALLREVATEWGGTVMPGQSWRDNGHKASPPSSPSHPAIPRAFAEISHFQSGHCAGYGAQSSAL
eukprot:COSAG02_NODE_3861_length_6130_cov_16.333112_5_plen_145_part_00